MTCSETAEERAARLEREKQREVMRRQRERDARLKRAGRRTQEERERERDISEKIALGQAAVAASAVSRADLRLVIYQQLWHQANCSRKCFGVR